MTANEPPFISRCGDRAPVFPGDTGPVICTRRDGHDGDHMGINYDLSYRTRQFNPRRWMRRDTGCERCGRDGPWTMVTDADGVTLALCGECIEAFAATQWTDDDAE